MVNGRDFLYGRLITARRLVLQFALLLLLAQTHGASAADPAISVFEVTMAAPDIVAVELREPEFVSGRIVTAPVARPELRGTWVPFEGSNALVIGPKGDHLRLADTPPAIFVDRPVVDDAQLYGPIGGRKVVAVYRKSMPYDSGLYRGPNGDSRTGASFKHLVYLKLDGNLKSGRHLVRWPSGYLPDTAFDFDDRVTRAIAIRSTQHGHGARDIAKVGYLALWLPGGPDEGAVDFHTYGLNRFDLVDAAGQAVFEGEIALRSGPDAPEPGNGLPQPLLDYARTDTGPIQIRTADPATGRVHTGEPHGFPDGDTVLLERLGGGEDAGATIGRVRDGDARSFVLDEPSSPLPAQTSPGATVRATHRANRAGTYVFTLDYSAFKGTGGPYRLRVPGIGVSDPFAIGEDVWTKAVKTSVGGLYNQRSGMALDGRFGFTRPVSFCLADQPVIQSRLPLLWSSNHDIGFLDFGVGAQEPWLAGGLPIADHCGGYMDAGDWDRRIQHVEVASLLIDAFEALPDDKKRIALDVPKSGLTLGHAAYRDTDTLPDLLHEAIWTMDFFRRMQVTEGPWAGSVRGGIESAAHPALGEPSYLEHQTVFVYAPDHLSTFQYAAVAARLAHILRELGTDEAAALFATSAEAAWSAGEKAFADPDIFYGEAIAVAQRTGAFESVSWPERRERIQREAAGFRAAAAAALYRLTGERRFGEHFENDWRAGADLYSHRGDAAWDYLQTPGTDASIVGEIEDRFAHEAAITVNAQASFAWPGMKHPFAPAGWGQGGAPDYNQVQLLTRAHRLTGDPSILRVMEQAYQGLVGVNQSGLSFITGLGIRQIRHPLHEDHRAMGVEAPLGITIFGYASQAQTSYSWVFGPPWSPLAEVGTAENAEHRRIEPSRFALPYHEYLVEHPAMIMQQEYTVHQSIATTAALALYLYGR